MCTPGRIGLNRRIVWLGYHTIEFELELELKWELRGSISFIFAIWIGCIYSLFFLGNCILFIMREFWWLRIHLFYYEFRVNNYAKLVSFEAIYSRWSTLSVLNWMTIEVELKWILFSMWEYGLIESELKILRIRNCPIYSNWPKITWLTF